MLREDADGFAARMTLDRAIADAPRWMFLLILVYAPLAYGCTRPLTITILNQLSAGLVVLWLGGCAWRRRWPRLPWLPVALLALLLLQGWWMAWNAHSVHQYRTWTTVNRIWDNPPLPGWPGAIDRRLAQSSMLNVTALFALFLFACDLMTRPVWRKRAWASMVLAAVLVAVAGTILKLGGPELREWLWDSKVAKESTTFAAYRYHGNAASLMSIGWALALGFAVAATGQRDQPLRLAGWMAALLGLLIGLFINTSRAGWGLGALFVLMIGVRFFWPWWCTVREHFDWKRGLLQAGFLTVVMGTLVAMTMSADWKEKIKRFHSAAEALQERYPSAVYHQLAKETGLLGYGPDSFQMALPVYMEIFGLANEKNGFWRHAHNDYYEYLVNWGWGGLALWTVLIVGGIVRGLHHHFRQPVMWGSTQWVLGFCGCAAMLGMLLHAGWDFPLEKASIILFFLTLLADGWADHEDGKEAAHSVPSPTL